jgi:hypothetical protein
MFTTVIVWCSTNPESSAAIFLWVLANVAPRPHHGHLTGYKRVVWKTIDRLCVLTDHALPGRFKMLFAASPAPPRRRDRQRP